MIKPVLAPIELNDELLGRVLQMRVKISKLFDHPTIARRAGVNCIQPVERVVLAAQSL